MPSDDTGAMPRSPENIALEKKYRAFRKEREMRLGEPKNTGRSLSEFVELTTKVAEEYQPSSYIKSAPIK
jgi:hypothetical protein